MILAGDIGGTKINLGIFETAVDGLKLQSSAGYRVADHASFDDVLGVFLKKIGVKPERACFGAAGLVTDGVCRLTNVPWEISASDLKRSFGFSGVMIVNDLAATAASVPVLCEADFCVLQTGVPVLPGRIGVLSSGTGLGQAFLIPDENDGYEILDTEGGQCGWAPTCREEIELISAITEEDAPVSIEDVLSGNGLVRLHQYFSGRDDLSARDIVEEGLGQAESVCRQTVDRFVSILGTVAGNMAVQVLTRGGIYLGGGIPAKLVARIQQPFFLDAFHNKRKFKDFLKSIPVHLITNEQAPLWGAANLMASPRIAMALG